MASVLNRLERLRRSPVARRFAGPAGIGLALRLAWAVINYASVVLLALWLLPESYGQYALVFSILRPASVIGGLGAETSLLRFLGEYRGTDRPDLARGVIAYALRSATGFSCLVALILIAFFWFLEAVGRIPSAWGYAIGMLLIPFYVVAGIQSAVARSWGKVLVALGPRDVLWRAALVAIGFVAAGLNSALAQIVAVMTAAVAALAVLVYLQHRFLDALARQRLPAATPLAQDRGAWKSVAVPIWVASMATAMLGDADTLIVGSMIDPVSAGRYFAIQRTAALVTFMQVSLNLLMGSEIARLYHAGKLAELQAYLKLAVAMVTVPAVCFVLVVLFAGRPLLGLLGPDFATLWPELVILCTGQAFGAMMGCVGMLLAMTGHERPLLRLQIVSTVVGLLAVIGGTYFAGTLGAAIGVASGIALRNLIVWNFARRAVPVEASILALVRRR